MSLKGFSMCQTIQNTGIGQKHRIERRLIVRLHLQGLGKEDDF